MTRDKPKPPGSSGAQSAAKQPAGNGLGDPVVLDPTTPSTELKKQSGRVQFDDRGNAVWEWAVATGSFGREVSSERMQKLENRGLSLAEDAPTPFDYVKPNPHGTVKGYNPYDSGKLGKAPPAAAPKKRDLRKLSEWLKLKKQASSNAEDKDEN